MKTPDEEIADKVVEKLQESGWVKGIIEKVSQYIKDGNVLSNDMVFLLENQRPEEEDKIK
jgi:hypothetical protein